MTDTEILEKLEAATDALDHIMRVCKNSRSQTRRTRWIEARAAHALGLGGDWREVDQPSNKGDGERRRIIHLREQRNTLMKLADSFHTQVLPQAAGIVLDIGVANRLGILIREIKKEIADIEAKDVHEEG